MTIRRATRYSHPRRRRSLVVLCAVTTAALGLTSCSSGFGSGDDRILDMRLSWQKDAGSAGAFVADQEGYYRDAGVDSVNLFSGGQSAPPVACDVILGNALIGIDGPDYAAEAATDGGPVLTMVGCQLQETPIAFLSRADSGIGSAQDLIGKTIGVQDANQTVMDAVLKTNHVDPSQVHVVPWQGDPTTLVGGEVDAVLGFGAEYTVALDQAGFNYRRDLVSEFGLHNMTYCYEVAKDLLPEKRDRIKGALEAEIRGWRGAMEDPQKAADYAMNIYGKDLGLDPETQVAVICANAELMVTDETRTNGLFTMSQASIDKNMDSLALSGLTDVNKNDLFDNSLLEEIYAEHPDLKTPPRINCR
jgi:ABC-type nitrate/sulfonate/bicarbonate transport system substrate-binding protein